MYIPIALAIAMVGVFYQTIKSRGICASEKVFASESPNPRQVYHFQQISGSMRCDYRIDGGCDVTSRAERNSIDLAASTTGPGWTSAGYDVLEASTYGMDHSCHAEPGETTCVWWRTASTQYTVTSQGMKFCQKSGNPVSKVIVSPNANNLGSSALCGRNEQCYWEGYRYWNNMERHNGGVPWAGGPQEWPFGDEKNGLVDFFPA
ncbi:hypothetical protein F66182_2198 [Fusarium sp. NRRL 66182]|nr:hypothetical protein F66182_2198 [Fusarium sp. NRRL 66182]